jgi:hypothetical protein
MEKKEVINILETLNSMGFAEQHKELEKYSVETLESLAVEIDQNDFRGKASDHHILHLILRERANKLNKNFQWTSDNIDRLLKINEKFMEEFEMAYKEAKSVVINLEKRIQDNAPFLKDYEVEIEITPYIMDELTEGEETSSDFTLVLSESMGSAGINYCFNLWDRTNIMNDISLPIFIDRSQNWNNEYFGETFSNYYIGYPIHRLLDNYWSFADLLKINTIWADVKIEHQHFFKMKGE